MSMQPYLRHAGTGLPLRRGNVDTDQIIPARFLKRITRAGFEDGLFAAWRTDSDFVLNRAAFAGASILVAGRDFGTGSSREHAVWALQDYGFRAVISSRFGDIFRTNAGKAGLLAAVVDDSVVESLWSQIEADPSTMVVVDLESLTLRFPGAAVAFDVDPYTRWRLMEGLDDIGITMNHVDQIAAHEERRCRHKPVVSRR